MPSNNITVDGNVRSQTPSHGSMMDNPEDYNNHQNIAKPIQYEEI
tara:strand:- start:1825 stop:1959 length:135 start_codon:yes stop_codon:yes gene_type:complete